MSNTVFNSRIRESVSALMDGECDELELRRLMSEGSADEVDETWKRYHLIRNAMQNESQSLTFSSLDISQQVRAAIADEVSNASEESNNSKSVTGQNSVDGDAAVAAWYKPVVGFAVAASVAFAVVLGVQNSSQTIPGLQDPINSSTVVASNAATSRVYPVTGSSLQASTNNGQASAAPHFQSRELPGNIAAGTVAADLEAQQRLEKFMLRHTERAALNNGQGMISFARVASFETE